MALTTEFVTSVRRQGSIPTTMTTADILAVGDEEIQARFVALLESVRQNYMVRELIATPDVRGKVPLPPRASGAAVPSRATCRTVSMPRPSPKRTSSSRTAWTVASSGEAARAADISA